MRQKILINLLAGVLFSGTCAVGVSAATVDVAFSKEQFVVSGEIESKKSGETVKLMVLNPDKTLEDAMVNPEKYKSLTVRLYGFSEYFVSLPKWQQLAILNRTEYGI